MKTAKEIGQYAFFLDIDGTLMHRGVICRKNRTAIARARRCGHLVFINTARSLSIIPQKILNIKTDGIISSLGCSFVIRGEHRVCGGFSPAEAWEVMEYLTEKGCRVLYETENSTLQNILWGEPNEKTVTSLAQMERALVGDNVAKAYLAGIVPEEVGAHLSEKYLFFQHPDYAEYSVPGHTKSTGIGEVAAQFGVPLSRCVAMGDSLNDKDMLEYCGISVAMGDGHPQIREISTFVTCNARDGGVAEGFYRVLGE